MKRSNSTELALGSRLAKWAAIGCLGAALLALNAGRASAQFFYSPDSDRGPMYFVPAGPPVGPGIDAPSGFDAPAMAPAPPFMRRMPVARRRPRRIERPTAAIRAAVPQGGPVSFGPDTVSLTRQAAARYAGIVQAGGWPVVPTSLKPGSSGPAVDILRRRLAFEGYLDPKLQSLPDLAGAWDPQLTQAVKKFQASVGLAQTGIVSGATLKALNTPAEERLRQLASTADRLSALSFPFGKLYVTVNIPAETVEAVANGEVAHRYAAVVGGPEHRSPEIQAQIRAININPTWTVPSSIIKNEIIPKLRRDPFYLAREHIRVLDAQGREINPLAVDWNGQRALSYTLRQDSGPFNSLGSLRINMPNDQAVYMHDTPAKGLFERSYRFLSHGCVRVDGVYDLAAWLLRETGNPHWNTRALLSAVASGDQKTINLNQSVPVIWVYMTGWADRDGVHFRDDVYHEDKAPDAMAHSALR